MWSSRRAMIIESWCRTVGTHWMCNMRRSLAALPRNRFGLAVSWVLKPRLVGRHCSCWNTTTNSISVPFYARWFVIYCCNSKLFVMLRQFTVSRSIILISLLLNNITIRLCINNHKLKAFNAGFFRWWPGPNSSDSPSCFIPYDAFFRDSKRLVHDLKKSRKDDSNYLPM